MTEIGSDTRRYLFDMDGKLVEISEAEAVDRYVSPSSLIPLREKGTEEGRGAVEMKLDDSHISELPQEYI